jgi:hypothetical protein
VRETDEEAEMRERRAERPAPDRSIMALPECCCKEGLIERELGHRQRGSYSIQLEVQCSAGVAAASGLIRRRAKSFRRGGASDTVANAPTQAARAGWDYGYNLRHRATVRWLAWCCCCRPPSGRVGDGQLASPPTRRCRALSQSCWHWAAALHWMLCIVPLPGRSPSELNPTSLLAALGLLPAARNSPDKLDSPLSGPQLCSQLLATCHPCPPYATRLHA